MRDERNGRNGHAGAGVLLLNPELGGMFSATVFNMPRRVCRDASWESVPFRLSLIRSSVPHNRSVPRMQLRMPSAQRALRTLYGEIGDEVVSYSPSSEVVVERTPLAHTMWFGDMP